MIIKSYLREVREKYRLRKHQDKWLKVRGNNFTRAGTIFPVEKVHVGSFTYGCLNVHYYNQPEEKLEIGSYCSIADNVQIFTGGGT